MTPTLDRDISHLYPPFAADVEDALLAMSASNLEIFVFEGFRTQEQQAERYSHGRTTFGQIVTYAKPGLSWHQYGLAVDLVFGGPGKWTWDGNYDRVKMMMGNRGFETLVFEKPHFQKTYGLSLDEAFKTAKAYGLPAVWKFIDNLSEGLA